MTRKQAYTFWGSMVLFMVAIAYGGYLDHKHGSCRIERDITMSGHDVLVDRCRAWSGIIEADTIVEYLN